MSVLGFPEPNNSDLQIWNNAAFDNGCDESEDSSFMMMEPISISSNPSDSFDSFSSKENQTPRFVKSPVAVQSAAAVPFRPLNLNSGPIGIGNSAKKPVIKMIPKVGVVEKKAVERKIDDEIEEIESEIGRLSSRLEALRLEKAERNAKNLEKSGRIVAAKFMEQKQSGKNGEGARNVEERLKLRRGFSMGPNEIMGVGKSNSKQSGKQEITPLQPINSRRKSCFWKLQDIEEENLSKGGRRVSSRFSLSPKSRKSIGKAQGTRQAVRTVGSKKGLKKEDGVLNAIQPKKLFVKDGEKSVPAKKPTKPGRIIASRYNQSATTNSAMRKRSLPENDKDESKRCDKKRASSVEKPRETESCRVKKRWEIPSEIIIPKQLELDEKSPPGTSVVRGVLPRIRAVRCPNETPRDSGPAKRVAELIRKKSFFGDDEEVEPSVCQVLSFAEDFEEGEE